MAYAANAASIYVEKAEHLVIRNCELHDSGNGLFVGVFDGATQDVRIERNFIHGNGNLGCAFEHNSYTAARGIVFEGNRFGPLRSGASGNNLKDRSAGLVVRYNWIESGNRQLDLVDGEDSAGVANDPRYRQTFVYGNVLIEPDGAGNSQIAHYGGDSGNVAIYRKGMLYFYHNTVVSTRTGNTDQFVGCVLWVMGGPWRGWYAKVLGNDRTDGSGVTRLYLSLQSQAPSRKDIPPGGVDCVILQHRQKNWMVPPCPSSAQRGLNALDDEVVGGRADWWSGQTFKLLSSRLNAGKSATITFAPPDPLGANATTGEPNTNLWPRADVFASIADIRTAFSSLVAVNRSGVVQFRQGTYDPCLLPLVPFPK